MPSPQGLDNQSGWSEEGNKSKMSVPGSIRPNSHQKLYFHALQAELEQIESEYVFRRGITLVIS